MAGKGKSKLRQMTEEYGIKDMNDVHEFVKMLITETIQAAHYSELNLGYSKYDYKNKQTETTVIAVQRKRCKAATVKWRSKSLVTGMAN